MGSEQPPQVALMLCPDYSRESVERAVSRCFDLLGGAKSLLPSEPTVLVKPNLLLAIGKDRAVTTHPEVSRAVIRLLQRQAGAKVLLGDSPMFHRTRSALRRCGYGEVLDHTRATQAVMEQTCVLHNDAGIRWRRFEVAKELEQVDGLVNICKLKTHGITGLTLSIKNLLGVVPGLDKSKWHLRAPSHEEMTLMLVDLYRTLQEHFASRCPMVHFADAVVGLEGEGPGSAGKPRQVGLIAASLDPVALDAVLARAVGFAPQSVTTTAEAAKQGLGTMELEHISILGDDVPLPLVEDFVPCRRSLMSGAPPTSGWPFNIKFFRDRMVERPLLSQAKCEGCSECKKVCAAGAITVEGKPKRARINDSDCIRCYCCIEVCQYEAVRLGARPLLARAADHRHTVMWVLLILFLLGAASAALLWALL